MANAIGIIVIIGAILVAMTFFRDGSDTIVDSPLQSTIESGKIVFEAGKNIVQQGQQTFNQIQNQENTEPNLIEVGQIPCATDDDCNEFLSQCDDDCLCIDLICWQEE